MTVAPLAVAGARVVAFAGAGVGADDAEPAHEGIVEQNVVIEDAQHAQEFGRDRGGAEDDDLGEGGNRPIRADIGARLGDVGWRQDLVSTSGSGSNSVPSGGAQVMPRSAVSPNNLSGSNMRKASPTTVAMGASVM
jgi:hypothetical protein